MILLDENVVLNQEEIKRNTQNKEGLFGILPSSRLVMKRYAVTMWCRR